MMAAQKARRVPIKDGPKDGMTFGAAPDYGHDRGPPPDTATSIFDPTLCELSYRWFCPPQGRVLDPFAGGSVRGIVASRLFRHYVGIDLSTRQIEANRAQLHIADPDFFPQWIEGDSAKVLTQELPALVDPFDYIFTCPPYADLERYSDDPADLSTMAYGDFRRVYQVIIDLACRRLRNDRFATVVVGDVRGKDGCYYGLPWHTVDAFQRAGLKLYNEGVLVTMVGSLAIRARQGFLAARKLGKSHQNVLTFVKGDPVKATKEIGDVDFGEAEEPTADEGLQHGEESYTDEIGREDHEGERPSDHKKPQGQARRRSKPRRGAKSVEG